MKDFCSWQQKLCVQGCTDCKDSVASLWICPRHLRNLHGLMTMINLCFKPTNASVRAELGGFYSIIRACLQLGRGLFWVWRSVLQWEAPAGKMLRLRKMRVLPNFSPPHFAAYNHEQKFCFCLDFLFLAKWVPQEGANTPNFPVDVIALQLSIQ